MIAMAQVVELTIGDSPATSYVVERTLEDGRVILRPRTQLEEMQAGAGGRPLSDAEFNEFIAPYLKPSDGEG
jgi:hypothetical protein